MKVSGFNNALGFGPSLGFGRTSDASPSSTTIAMGSTWIWPNNGESQYLIVVNSAWMVVGQHVRIDGVITGGAAFTGELVVSNDNDPIVGYIQLRNDLLGGPAGSTEIDDGSLVTLLP